MALKHRVQAAALCGPSFPHPQVDAVHLLQGD